MSPVPSIACRRWSNSRREEQLSLAKHEERLVGLQTAAERLERDQQTRLQQRDEAERRLAAVIEKRREIMLHIFNTNATLAELALEQERIAQTAGGFSRQKETLRGRRAVLLKEETKLRAERRELNDRQHCVEIDASGIRHQLATLDEKIQEEYQVPLEEVVGSGASAYHDYLDENYPGWRNPTQADGPTSGRARRRNSMKMKTFDETESEELEEIESTESDSEEDLEEEELADEEDDELSDHAGERFRQELPEYEDIREDLGKPGQPAPAETQNDGQHRHRQPEQPGGNGNPASAPASRNSPT